MDQSPRKLLFIICGVTLLLIVFVSAYFVLRTRSTSTVGVSEVFEKGIATKQVEVVLSQEPVYRIEKIINTTADYRIIEVGNTGTQMVLVPSIRLAIPELQNSGPVPKFHTLIL